MNRVITLTTDFGVRDGYVAAMKGVILSINPGATVVDVSHDIEPQNIHQGAYVLSSVYSYFPRQTVHIAVVDPGVGTQRRAIVLVAPDALFVAPDNGILSYIIADSCPQQEIATTPEGLSLCQPCPPMRAIALTNKAYWHPTVSLTFHGRDIFAPVAAHLSMGINPLRMGEEIESIIVFPILRPVVMEDGTIVGHVIHVDRFGNLITDIRQQDISSGKMLIMAAGQTIEGISPTYAEGGALLATVGSSGRLEVAMKNNSASQHLGLRIGDEIQLKPVSVIS